MPIILPTDGVRNSPPAPIHSDKPRHPLAQQIASVATSGALLTRQDSPPAEPFTAIEMQAPDRTLRTEEQEALLNQQKSDSPSSSSRYRWIAAGTTLLGLLGAYPLSRLFSGGSAEAETAISFADDSESSQVATQELPEAAALLFNIKQHICDALELASLIHPHNLALPCKSPEEMKAALGQAEEQTEVPADILCLEIVGGSEHRGQRQIVDCGEGDASQKDTNSRGFAEHWPVQIFPEKSTSTTEESTPFPTTVRPSTTTLKGAPKARYNTLKTQPAVCLEDETIARCEEVHAGVEEPLHTLGLIIKSTRCFCPPPQSRRDEFELVYLDQPDIIPSPGLPNSTTLSPPPVKRRMPYEQISRWKNPLLLPTTTTTTTEGPLVDVKMTRLFNFDCVEVRENLNTADILRVVGNTLSSPVRTMSQETAVVMSHMLHGEGCPSDDMMASLERITLPIDIMLSAILTALPGSEILGLAQFFAGPGLLIIADGMEGKKISSEDLIMLNTQLWMMIRHSLPTLKPSERVPLYNKFNSLDDKITKAEREIIQKRFSFKDNKVQIKVGDKSYPLRETFKNAPFIIDDNKRARYVYYHRVFDDWVFVDREHDRLYANYNRDNAQKYKISLGELAEGSSIQADDKTGRVTISTPGEAGVREGVFVGNEFIPVKFKYVHGKIVATTNTPGQQERLALAYTFQNWVFDSPSVKMDNYLKLLLESKNNGMKYPSDYTIGPISDFNGFSSTDNNVRFIKKDNRYYKVSRLYDQRTNSHYFSLTDHPNSIIRYENKIFKLEMADDMLFGMENSRIKNDALGVDVFYIENTAFDYLWRNGMQTENAPIIFERAGIYRDAQNQGILQLGDDYCFLIDDVTEDEVIIKNKSADKKSIRLWEDDSNYIRIRSEETKPANKYRALTNCRVKKSPVQGEVCKPVKIEEDLHNLLLSYIQDKEMHLPSPTQERLAISGEWDIPYLYEDVKTRKNYFYYNNAWFDAKILSSMDKDNPTGLTGVRLTGKGSFFSKETFIADVVVDEIEGRLEIKTVEAWVAEKVNVDKGIATAYVKNRPWRTIANAYVVEELAMEAQASSEKYVDVNGITAGPSSEEYISFLVEWDMAKRALFPERIVQDNQYFVKTFSLGAEVDTLEPYERAIARLVKEKISYVRKLIMPSVISSLDYASDSWSGVRKYLSEVLQSNDDIFLMNFANALSGRIEKAKIVLNDALRDDKIYLAKALRHLDATADIDHSTSLLTSEERESGPVAVMPNYYENRIYINIDKIDTTENISPAPASDLNTYIINAVTHTGGVKTDFNDIEKVDGMYIHISDAITDMAGKMGARLLTPEQTENLNRISSEYFKNVATYRPSAPEMLDVQKMAYLVNNDSGYLAHLLLNSPGFVTLLTEDIFYLESMAGLRSGLQRMDGWMRKYARYRSFDVEKGIQTVRRTLPSGKVLENIETTDTFEGEKYLAFSHEIPSVSNAIEHPQGNSAAILDDVAEFMRLNGFSRVHYRGVAMFMGPQDNMPILHYVVTGFKDMQKYVFDLAAGEFAQRYPELNGPIILPERVWAQKYAHASDKLLVKYADYETAAQARTRFSPGSKYITWGPETKIPNAWVLKHTDWYFPELRDASASHLPGTPSASRLGYTNVVREAARRSQLSGDKTMNAGDYAVSLLENAELLSQEPAIDFRTNIKQAIDFQRDTEETPGGIDGLFSHSQVITNTEEMLRIGAGQVIVVMEKDPTRLQLGPRPIHVMTATGNGRFAGIKNRVLDAALSNDKGIFTAEQLGEFKDGKFCRRGANPELDTHLIAGSPIGLEIPKSTTLRELAERTPALSERVDIVNKMTEMLRVSGEFAAEQTIALKGILTPMFKKTAQTGGSGRMVQHLFTSPARLHTQAELAALPKGVLVVFGNKSSSSSIDHMMYSLGNGEFVMVGPSHMDSHITSPNAIVYHWQFPDELLANHQVYAGELSLSELRVPSLLGLDARFVVRGSTLEITAHGAAYNVGFMDTPELLEVIKGLGLRDSTQVDWSKIDQINLNSCYSALGRYPTGRAVANALQKKVRAWPRLYSAKLADSPLVTRQSRTFLPEPMTANEMQLRRQQDTRNHYFWSYLLHGWVYRTIDRLKKRAGNSEDHALIREVMSPVFDVAVGVIPVENFFVILDDYKKSMFLNETLFREVLKDQPATDEEFAERCMDILNLSEYTVKSLDEFLKDID